MPSKKKENPIYTNDYYRMAKLTRNAVFKAKLKKLLENYEEIGCPIPKGGFKNHDQHIKWLNTLFDKHEKMERANMEEEFLPPIIGYWRDDILTEFGFDPKNSKYTDFLDSYILFGKKNLEEYSFETRWIRNTETDKMELFIHVYPYTKREHVSKYWKHVVKEQEHMPEYLGKSKKWETFDRDLEIYTAYEKLRSGRTEKRAEDFGGALDQHVWSEMRKKYKKLKLDDVRRAVSRVAKLDLKV